MAIPNRTVSLYRLNKIPAISFLLIPLGTIGTIFIAWLTPFGVGIYVDTLYYVSSAQNLLAGIGMGRVTGLGVFKPMTHYPPFYSLILALFHLLGLDELTTARWISILAFGITIILAGLIVYQRTHSIFFSALVAALFLLSSPILRVFSWAMTEPLYIVLMLLGILFIGYYLGNPRRLWLVFTSVLTGLSLLTRYVGFSLVGAFFIVLLVNFKLDWRRRVQDIAIFLSISLIPTLAWLVRNWMISGTLTNRALRWHPISNENITFIIKSFNSWGLLPQRLIVGRENVAFLAIAFVFIIVGIYWLRRSFPKNGKSPSLEFVILLSGWAYAALLVISLFFIDATTRLENRILLPLYVMIFLLIFIAANFLWQYKASLTHLAAILVCFWLAYFSITRVDGVITELRVDGQGYASRQWQTSPTAKFIRTHGASLIYTNDVTAIYFLTNQDSVAIPNANSTEADFKFMRSNLGQPDSYVVIFGSLTGEFATLEKITQGLVLVSSFNDGKIYQLR